MKYRDPLRTHAEAIHELRPQQYADAVSTVARNAERGGWPTSEVAQVLSMLGIDQDRARDAKTALRRAQRLRLVHGGPERPVTRPMGQLEARTDGRDALGRFVTTELCAKGLHELTGANRLTRADRKSIQCKACTRKRKVAQYARELAAAQQARRIWRWAA